jgi:hypothetical protein
MEGAWHGASRGVGADTLSLTGGDRGADAMLSSAFG